MDIKKVVANKILEGAINKINNEAEFEWVKFSCSQDHTFALELPVGEEIDKRIITLQKVVCPICGVRNNIKMKGAI